MASIVHALSRIKSELDQIAPAELIHEFCKQVGHRWRERILNPATTIQLMLLQLLAKVSLAGLRRVSKVAASAQAICAARKRLPLEVMIRLVEYAGKALGQTCIDTWKGFRVVLADGSSFMTEDTPELAKTYGRARNQRGTSCSYPVPKLLALLDLASGLIHKLITLPCDRGERAALSRMFRYLQKGDLMLGDRGLASFAHLALMVAQGLHACMRVPEWLRVQGHGRTHGRPVKRLGQQDWLVRWMPDRRPRWMKPAEWKKMPAELTLRQIAFRLCRPGFRTRWAWVVTTLLDPVQYPAQEIVQLYERRWQVEVCFRDLKQSLGFRKLSAKRVAGVRKEVLAFVLLYNLVRRIMLQAARQQGVEPERISFIDAVRWLLWSEPGEPLPPLVVNPKRSRPSEPRMIKGGRRKHPRLKGRRRSLQRPRYVARI
jgi:hypothetical protein